MRADCLAVSHVPALSNALQHLPAHDIARAASCCKQFSSAVRLLLQVWVQDFARGLDRHAVPCINERDDEKVPSNFVYLPPDRCFQRVVDAHCDCGTSRGCSQGSCSCSGGPAFHTHTSAALDPAVDAIKECGPACLCAESPTSCQLRGTQQGVGAALALVKSAKGWSVQARQAIPCGAFVCEYQGEYITTSEAKRRLLIYDNLGFELQHRGPERTHLAKQQMRSEPEEAPGHVLQAEADSVASAGAEPVVAGGSTAPEAVTSKGNESSGRSWTPRWHGHALLVVRQVLPSGLTLRSNIDATYTGNIGRFINHSCDGGNLRLVLVHRRGLLLPAVTLFASRDIHSGEELTFAYGPPNGQPGGIARGPGPAPCLCDTSACLGWMPGE